MLSRIFGCKIALRLFVVLCRQLACPQTMSVFSPSPVWLHFSPITPSVCCVALLYHSECLQWNHSGNVLVKAFHTNIMSSHHSCTDVLSLVNTFLGCVVQINVGNDVHYKPAILHRCLPDYVLRSRDDFKNKEVKYESAVVELILRRFQKWHFFTGWWTQMTSALLQIPQRDRRSI